MEKEFKEKKAKLGFDDQLSSEEEQKDANEGASKEEEKAWQDMT